MRSSASSFCDSSLPVHSCISHEGSDAFSWYQELKLSEKHPESLGVDADVVQFVSAAGFSDSKLN